MPIINGKKMTPMSRIRNIGFIAHIDAGKTTTTERVLYYSGVTYKMGEVHEGSAVMDWMDQEQERGITITSAAITCQWKGHQVNIIDTPGHVDFTVEVERSLKVLDGAVIILCGVGGVEPQTEKVWNQSTRYELPAIFYINKMDRNEADYRQVLDDIKVKLGVETLLMQLPYHVDNEFKGVVDLLEEKTFFYNTDLLGVEFEVMDVPEELKEETTAARNRLIEKIAENDEQLMEMYLEKETDIPRADLKAALKRIVHGHRAFPVLMGSSFKNKGVQNLMDAVVEYLPPPDFRGTITAYRVKDNKPIERQISDDEKFMAFVFKTVFDRHATQQIYFRTYTGRLKIGDTVFNSRTDAKIRINKLFKIKSNKLEKIERITAGDIAVTLGIPDIGTGDTLCDLTEKLKLQKIQFPQPVMSSTIEPRLSSDHEKLNQVLDKLQLEDPTFVVKTDDETGQLIISGMGELHLEVIKERIRREFKVDAKLGRPRVAYRESVEKAATAEYRYDSEFNENKKHYGHVVVRVEPLPSCPRHEIDISVREKDIPQSYHQALAEGVRDSLSAGGLAGFPVIQVRVSIVGGSCEEEYASDFGYRISAFNAVQEACKTGGYTLLEPMMKIEILCPDDYIGEVINDLNAREGKVKSMLKRSKLNVVHGIVPLSRMFGYATAIRSLTQGRANYTMEFSAYEKMEKKEMQRTLKEELGLHTF